jgi:hypothetical protein
MDRHTIQWVHWAGHRQAVSSWTYAHRKDSLTKLPPTFLCKFLRGWLATGKMVARYNATLYPKECQSCQHPVEDQTHFLIWCTARSDWRNKFWDSLRKHSTTVDTTMIYVLEYFAFHVRHSVRQTLRICCRAVTVVAFVEKRSHMAAGSCHQTSQPHTTTSPHHPLA